MRGRSSLLASTQAARDTLFALACLTNSKSGIACQSVMIKDDNFKPWCPIILSLDLIREKCGIICQSNLSSVEDCLSIVICIWYVNWELRLQSKLGNLMGLLSMFKAIQRSWILRAVVLFNVVKSPDYVYSMTQQTVRQICFYELEPTNPGSNYTDIWWTSQKWSTGPQYIVGN